MKHEILFSQFEGCLLGGAIGDAIGRVVEKKPTSVAQDYVLGMAKAYTGFHASKYLVDEWNVGQVTDDTQFSHRLAESLTLDHKNFMPHFARLAVEDLQSNRIVGWGKNTKGSIQRLADGISWLESGGPGLGNGSAMRSAPIGLLYAFIDTDDAVNKVCGDAWLQSVMTHTDPRCCMMSCAQALATYYAIRKPFPVDGEFGVNFARSIARSLRSYRHTPSYAPEMEYIIRIGYFADMELSGLCSEDDALAFVMEIQEKQNGWEGITPFCVSSFLWALYSFLVNTGESDNHKLAYNSTIQTAIWPGGDVDSTASMAGQLAGAFYGSGALSNSILDIVSDASIHNFTQELSEISGRLFEIARDTEWKD